MTHYAHYNMSYECKLGSKIIAETGASIAESFLYVYLGFSALSIDPQYINLPLLLIVSFGVVVSRLVGVFVPYLMMRLW